MTAAELRSTRATLGLTQAAMAQRVGLNLRSYSRLESGAGRIRLLHENAVRWVAGLALPKSYGPYQVSLR